jgi:hypothetical protein
LELLLRDELNAHPFCSRYQGGHEVIVVWDGGTSIESVTDRRVTKPPIRIYRRVVHPLDAK